MQSVTNVVPNYLAPVLHTRLKTITAPTVPNNVFLIRNVNLDLSQIFRLRFDYFVRRI